MQDLLNKIYQENMLSYERQSFESLKFYSYVDQIDCILNQNIPVVSFTFGTLNNESIKALKKEVQR